MISLFLCHAPASVTYQIPQKVVPYNLSINLDGYIPVIVHRDGKVDLEVEMTVKGLPPDPAGNEKATTDVSSLRISLDGSVLPIDRDAVDQYFPETVTLSPQGKVIENSMPKQVDLPIHLPGIDIKRLPDMSFLAIEFPSQGIQQSTPWTFSRDYGSSAVNYTITPTSISDDKVEMDVSFTQDYTDLEGDAYEPVKDPRDAAYDVSTHVAGTGTAEFDRKLGLISSVHVKYEAKGEVSNIQTKLVTHRDLKTAVNLSLAE